MNARRIAVRRLMSASAETVWELFADFPHLARHWHGLRSSTAIGDRTGGVGARRRVALRPLGNMVEVVTDWEVGTRIATRNRPSILVPIAQAASVLVLEPSGTGTLATFEYRYTPRGGALGRFTGPWLDRMLTATFTDMLAATDQAASTSRRPETDRPSAGSVRRASAPGEDAASAP